MTGQEFNFDNPMPEGFIYDTELPSRAVVAISEINPEFTLPFFNSIQHAFYLEKKDVTDINVLSKIAAFYQVKPQEFLENYNNDDVKEKTQIHFQYARQAGVTGFPTLVISTGKHFRMLAHGYRSYQEICKDLDIYLNEIDLEVKK